MRRLVFAICLLVGMAAGGAEVYRWVDEDGQVHFSDRPQEGAERVELRDVQTFSVQPVRPIRRAGTDADDAADEAQNRYGTLEFVRPGQEEVLWNIEGQLDVSMRLEPRLQAGHSVSLYLNDQKVEGMGSRDLQAQVPDVARGTHVLRAEVRDPSGTVLIRSQPRTFFVRQTSILSPGNPVNAPAPGPR